ncbi:MAG: oligosaccharide flippase family protein, partial [Halobacteriovoraceae bacterium]|nr:oligosaccharide flippase family protein [Halobacteriovoraceae bacterium]
MSNTRWTPADLARKSRSGFVSLVQRSFLINVMQIASSVVLARYLNQTDFAIFGILNGWVISLIYFTDFGIGDYLSQKGRDYTDEDLSFYFFVRIILTSIATLGFFFIMPLLLDHYKIDLIYKNFLYLLPLFLPLDVLAASTRVKLDLNLKFKKISS